VRRPLALALCLAGLGGAGCGSDDEPQKGSAPAPPPPTTTAADGCRDVRLPAPKPEGTEQRPSAPLPAGKRFSVTFSTTCGDFTVRLDPRQAPRTAASLVALARSGFYDNTVFHRIVPGFVIQGGDPTGSGQGGPGYSTRDVPPRDARYTQGVVAMAKTAEEPPGTAGSQFYVVTGEDAGLPPEYAIVGKVSEGLDVVRRIGELGDPASGQEGAPSRPVVIEKATVAES
jgi:cyclophilin family peptidyl-prolyl cis-trans isomerase